MPRYAMVTVVEADFAEIAWESVAQALGCLPKPADAEIALFVGDALEVAELDDYDSRSLIAAISTHPDLPGEPESGYSIWHRPGEGFTLKIGPATYGPYDCDEREAIKRAHHDAGAGDPFASASLPQRAVSAVTTIAEGVPREDEWRSAASFMEHVAAVLERFKIKRPAHYADEDDWR